MIDIVDIKGKKFVFIDETVFSLVIFNAPWEEDEYQEDEYIQPGHRIDHSSFQRREKLGERMMY